MYIYALCCSMVLDVRWQMYCLAMSQSNVSEWRDMCLPVIIVSCSRHDIADK